MFEHLTEKDKKEGAELMAILEQLQSGLYSCRNLFGLGNYVAGFVCKN